MNGREVINKLKGFKSNENIVTFIRDNFIKDGHLPLCISRPIWVQKNIPEFNSYIASLVDVDLTLPKRIYLLLNNMNTFPLCQVCQTKIPIKKINLNISPFCGNSCMNTKQGTNIRQKIKDISVLKKYNVKNVMHIKDVKDTHIKAIRNVDYVSRQKKIERTNMRKYGVKNVLHVEKIKQKSVDTNIEKYGKTNYTKTLLYKQKHRKSILNNKEYNCNNKDWLYEQYVVNKLNVYQIGELDNIDSTCITWRLRHFNIEVRGKGASDVELQVRDYVRSIYKGEIITGKRTIIRPLELDIYLPELNLAIELNGIYWHSYPFLSQEIAKVKHVNKFNRCEDKNISLLQVSDIDWVHNNELIKSMIKSRLGIIQNKIFARKTKIIELTNEQVNTFLELNHIQGSTTQTSTKIGLIYEGELCTVMTFSKRKDSFELTRFASIINHSVIGGFSKLLSFFQKNINKDNLSIVSFLSLSYGKHVDNIYVNNGFIEIRRLKEDYQYFCIKLFGSKTVHKSNLRKSKLRNICKENNITYNEQLTEFQLVELLNNNKFNIFRIYDSGKIKYSLNTN